MRQRRKFCRQRIQEPSCASKATVEIDNLLTSRKDDKIYTKY